MEKIQTFVVFDLETTGLPHLEYNSTKITEICLIAAARKDIRTTQFGELPPVSKLSFVLNPEKTISVDAARLTGISNKMVKNAPTFREIFKTIRSFLEDLKKPVCLVAHNGNTFDYKILLAECIDANVVLPNDILCMDSLVAFRKLHKLMNDKSEKVFNESINRNAPKDKKKKNREKMDKSKDNINFSIDSVDRNNDSLSDIMTDEEDEWAGMNVTPEEFAEIDELCASLHNMSATSIGRENLNTSKRGENCTEEQNKSLKETKNFNEKSKIEKNMVHTVNKSKNFVQSNKQRVSFKLTSIYTRYFGGLDDKNAHRAEDDCLMLLQCIVAAQSTECEEDFIKWSDANCKLLTDMAPLIRKNKTDYLR